VEFLEDVADSELAVLICGADLLIQPSFFEGFGLPPLEAMAAGTPVLVARAGALPEV
jgi:glycosyltransferase involved in cell wall biosynthesis